MNDKMKRVIVAISGGISAYKSPEIVRRLKQLGMEVRVVMTENALRFISSLTLEAVSNHPVYAEFDGLVAGDDHIALSEWGDLLLVAPATYNIIGKFACGIADDFLSTLFSASLSKIPVIICPSMHESMYKNPILRKNLKTLTEMGVKIVQPEKGALLRGEGEGRLARIDTIVEHVEEAFIEQDLKGLNITVTAGPTREYIDKVRFISNASSGKMGFLIAKRAKQRGAEVTLITGPSMEVPIEGVSLIRVTTTNEMEKAVLRNCKGRDFLVMSAAVSDWKTKTYKGKLFREEVGERLLKLEPTEDILKKAGEEFPNLKRVGFSLELTEDRERARRKMREKGVSIMVLNTLGEGRGFGGESIDPIILYEDGREEVIGTISKRDFAEILLTRMRDL